MSIDDTSPTRPADVTVKICPFLGIEEDPQTCLGYASPWNFCYRSQPAQVVRLSHQHTTCLCMAHVACTVFQNDAAQPLPLELRPPDKPRLR